MRARSGARIGETLQLKKEDFELDAEPPRVHIRAEYTKGGVGARITYFSFEARDAIKDWLAIKDGLKKKMERNTETTEFLAGAFIQPVLCGMQHATKLE